MAKTILVVLGIALLALAGYLAYGYHSLTLQSEAAARVRAELQPRFQATLTQYQRDLPIGTRRSEVKKYLDARKLVYSEGPERISVLLGDEPDVFPCDRWGVYISLQFFSEQQVQQLLPESPNTPTPLVRLASVSLQRIGHCL